MREQNSFQSERALFGASPQVETGSPYNNTFLFSTVLLFGLTVFLFMLANMNCVKLPNALKHAKPLGVVQPNVDTLWRRLHWQSGTLQVCRCCCCIHHNFHYVYVLSLSALSSEKVFAVNYITITVFEIS